MAQLSDPNLIEAGRIANNKAAALLLEDYDLAVKDMPQSWLFIYTPKGRVRGGGFQITIDKSSRQVIDVLRFQ